MKSIVDGLGAICDETVDIPETTSISPKGKENYWLIAVFLLAIACLLLLSFLSIYETCVSNSILISVLVYNVGI